jgi:hypothetical protein
MGIGRDLDRFRYRLRAEAGLRRVITPALLLAISAPAWACGSFTAHDHVHGEKVRFLVHSVTWFAPQRVAKFMIDGDAPWDLRVAGPEGGADRYRLDGGVLSVDGVAVGAWNEDVLTLGGRTYTWSRGAAGEGPPPHHRPFSVVRDGVVVLDGQVAPLCLSVGDGWDWGEEGQLEEMRRRLTYYLAWSAERAGESWAGGPAVEVGIREAAGSMVDLGMPVPGRPAAGLTVTASSALASDTGRYLPARLGDGDPGTAWCEGAEGLGVGETIRVTLPTPGHPIVGVTPGYFKSADVLRWNGRVRRLRVSTDVSAPIDLVFPALDGTGDPLRLAPAWVDLDAPGASWVEAMVVEVDPGTKHADTCISAFDIRIR